MKTSAAGLAFIAQVEGTVLHVYTDSVGIATIGVGHVVRRGESFPGGITQAQAMDLLSKDVAIAETAVNDGVKVTITQDQFDSLVSFTFNVGTGSFKSSTLLKKLNAGDVEGAADEFLKWAHGGGKVIPGLLKRRNLERDLFLKGTVVVQKSTPSHEEVGHAAKELIEMVRSYVGCSLKARRDDLGKLVARGVDDPEAVVTIATNCATTALGIMAAVGVEHPLLKQPYVNGMAISWVRKIAQDLGALVHFDGKTMPKPGSLLRYNTFGKNDDHVEWLLGSIDVSGAADHAGGGRKDNAITEGTSNVLSNWNRPLVEWIDPDKLLPILSDEPDKAPVDPASVSSPAPVVVPAVEPTVPVPAAFAEATSSMSIVTIVLNFISSLFGSKK